MSRVRVAVVGAGSWGRNHVRTLAGMAEAELVAVCDVDERRLTQVQRQLPAVRVTARLAEALDGPEAVVVTLLMRATDDPRNERRLMRHM